MHFNEIFKVLSNILSSYFLGLFFVLRILMLQRHSKTIYNLLNSAIPVFLKMLFIYPVTVTRHQ